jgi:hypothetical protein
MATVNKNFRIKHGLVVEGTTGTINGQNILTETGSDTYILNLIGGETLVKSVAGNLAVDGAGELTINETGLAASLTENSNYLYDDGAGDINVDVEGLVVDGLVDTSSSQTLTNKTIGDVLTFNDGSNNSTIDVTGNDLTINANSDLTLSTGNGDIVLNPDGSAYIGSSSSSNNLIATRGYADGLASNYDAAGAASTAETNANSYTDTALGSYTPTSSLDTTVDGYGYLKSDDLSGYATESYVTSQGYAKVPDGSGFTLDAYGYSQLNIDINNGIKLDPTSIGLSIDRTTVDSWYDPAGAASGALEDANSYTDSEITTALTTAQGYADQALSDANAYTDNAVSGLAWKSAVNLKSDSNIAVADSVAGLVIDGHSALTNAEAGYRLLLTGQTTSSQNGIWEVFVDGGLYIRRAPDGDTNDELIGAAVYVQEGTQYGSTSWVQSNHYIAAFAGQNWTQFSGQGSVTAGSGITVDGLEVSINRTTVDSWYDAAGDAADAQAAAETYADSLASNYDPSGSAQGAYDNAVIYADGLASNYDAAGSASAAQTAAQSYADGLASNYDAAGAASTAESNANTYADARVADLTNGTNSFQNLNIEDVIAQRAASTTAMGTTEATVFSWDGADYRSAKVLVKVANGVHTQISELMVTLDTANNVGISEYGITYSNGTELAAISASYVAGMINILATPANTNTDVVVFATLVI